MKFMFFANTDWYLYNFRLSTALHLKRQGADVVMVSPPGTYGDRFAEHGIRWLTLPMQRASLNPAREAITLRHMVRVLAAERPDLLHNFTVKCAVYGAIAARIAKVPAVVNAVAGLGYVFTSDAVMARTLRPVVKVLMRGTLGGANSRLILQNPDDADAFVNGNLVPEDRIRLIRSSGVDTTRFAPPRVAGRAQHKPLRVLLAARLLWEKGVQEFIDAAALVRGRGCEMEFLLAGTPDPGNPRSVDARHVQAWVRKGLVTWLGHVEDMPALLRSVDVMALPSYYREGVPKCLIEGAASGLALITTNLPGCREVVTEHGVDGLHAQPRDPASLAELLLKLDADRTLLRRLGESARCRAVSDFDERLVIERTVEVYKELLRPGWLPDSEPQQAAGQAA